MKITIKLGFILERTSEKYSSQLLQIDTNYAN